MAEMEEDHFTGKMDWQLWRRTLQFARPYRAHIALLMTIAVAVSLLDVALPRINGFMIDAVSAGDHAALRRLAFVYVGIVVLFTICINAFILTAGRISTGIAFDIRQASFDKLQQLPFAYYDRKAVGWLMARLVGDCGTLSRVMGWALLDFTWGTCVLIAVTVMMFHLNWKLALCMGGLLPLLLFVGRFFQVRLLLTSRALRKANSQTTAAFNEGIVGVRTSKSMVREARNLEEFSVLTGAMYTHALRNALYSAMFLPLMISICSLGTAVALWYGGIQVTVGSMSLGTIVTFLQYAGFLQFPVQELSNMFTQVQGAQASAERIGQLLDTDVEIRDTAEVMAALNSHRGQPKPGLAPDGLAARIESIEFRNVSFAYKAGKQVLDNFNLKVHAGQTIALVGATGGGKTTIVGLACRFYEPTAGEILINGIDYRRRSLAWLQSSLGMVLQQPHLFSGTVRENIRYGRLSATDAEVEAAARLVNAHDFIAELPKQYDTPVGEGGSRLSSGQKQLISLARAVIADPQIFVMDEATSSVDTQTERAIQEAIERVLENRIAFVIAHRLSTIRHADRILVIDKGRIIEDGTHQQLIARRGEYFNLYTQQFTHEREEAMLVADSAAVPAPAVFNGGA